jgi:transcriptional regulator with XRE-family HTH domain
VYSCLVDSKQVETTIHLNAERHNRKMIKKETRTVVTGVRALAKKVGCSPTLVSWVISGKRNGNTPMGRRIMRLASRKAV